MDIWQRCVSRLEDELSAQQFNTWIRPLQSVEEIDRLRLLAPNRFVLDWVRNHYLDTLRRYLSDLSPEQPLNLSLEIAHAPSEKIFIYGRNTKDTANAHA